MRQVRPPLAAVITGMVIRALLIKDSKGVTVIMESITSWTEISKAKAIRSRTRHREAAALKIAAEVPDGINAVEAADSRMGNIMKKLFILFLTFIFAMPAYADHGHGHGGYGGYWIGPAIVGGIITYDLTYPYRYPYYPYPYPVYAQPAPIYPQPAPAYAEPATPVQPPAQVWYYCDSAKGYYPYVANCPVAWRPVPAQLPPPSAPQAPPQ